MATVCPQCHALLQGGAGVCPRCQGARKPASYTWLIVLLLVLVLGVPMLGIAAVLGVYGVRKYIANAKTAEARFMVGQLAKSVAFAYENERRLCPSASAPVPADLTAVRGRKYPSTRAEWQADDARGAGFACLQFTITQPQYYQYAYTSTPTGFTVTARGDLDGDGRPSYFTVTGQIVGGRLVIAPQLSEIDPDE